MELIIEKARTENHKTLTELTIRSKDYWGYGIEQIEKWRDELTFTKEYIYSNHVFKAVYQKEIIGFYAYCFENEEAIKLQYFFFHPYHIGKGYGKHRITDFLNRVKTLNIKELYLTQIRMPRNFILVLDSKSSENSKAQSRIVTCQLWN